MSKNTNKHVGVNTGTIINTRRGNQKDVYKMEKHRFCNTCNNYCNGKCNAGDVKDFEIQDIIIADKCKYYSKNIEFNNYKQKQISHNKDNKSKIKNNKKRKNNLKKCNTIKESQLNICRFVTIRYEIIEKIKGKYKRTGNKSVNGLQIKNKVFLTDGHYKMVNNKNVKIIKKWDKIPEWATDDLISKYNLNKKA